MDYTNEYISGNKDYGKLFQYIDLIHSLLGNIMIQDPVYKKVLKILPGLMNKSDVALDYGCGIAYLTKKIRHKNYCIFGCDIVKPLINKLNDMDLTVFHVDDKRLDKTQFDLILLLEVLEHVPDPIEFLETMSKRFPSSRILISVPHCNRIPLSLGIEDINDKPPHHYTQFEDYKLENIVIASGYKIIKHWDIPVNWNEAIYGTMLLIMKWFGNKSNKQLNKFTYSKIKLFCYIVFYPILYVIGNILKTFFKSSSGRSYLILIEEDK